MKHTIPCPAEDEEQTALMQWATVMSGRYLHVSQFKRWDKKQARSRIQGCGQERRRRTLAGARSTACISNANGRASFEQKEWVDALRKQEYAAVICKGWKQAAFVVEIYPKGENAYGTGDPIWGGAKPLRDLRPAGTADGIPDSHPGQAGRPGEVQCRPREGRDDGRRKAKPAGKGGSFGSGAEVGGGDKLQGKRDINLPVCMQMHEKTQKMVLLWQER